jgi:tetratricopeptide (TPR) repeat protein
MSENKELDTVATEQSVIGGIQSFWNQHSKKIIYVGSAVIVLLLGWIGYQKFIVEPNEQKANETIFLAENLFDKMATSSFGKDSVGIALNGGSLDGANVVGLLKVISNYGSTKAANRARYMVGASYLQIKEFDKAIQYLKEFDGAGADQVQSKAYLMLGHAYAEKKQTNEALDYYKKAASVNTKDESVTPDALFTAALYAASIGQSKEAIELFIQLKEDYATFVSVTNGEVDKQLARLGQLN